MILTSSYSEWKLPSYMFRTYSISGDCGRSENYQGDCYLTLAPKRSFWRTWKDNIGIVPEEENNKFYVQEYWKQVLSELDPEQVYKELNNSVLLCYEPNTKFCHRHIVSAWFELFLDKKVKEAKSQINKIEYVSRPEYIKSYLEETIRMDKKMRGFKSLRALYLFEKAEMYEDKANEIGEKSEAYRQQACFLRCDADMAEEKYSSSTND